MKTAPKHFFALRVADVMRQEPVTVSVNATMAEAAQTLCCENIGGAPVVDEMGHCVGVLSAEDFAEDDQEDCSELQCAGRGDDHAIVSPASDAPVHIEWVRGDSVRQHMHSALQTICAQASLIDAARVMCSEHTHRIIVLDETSHPVGVASSFDILDALVRES